MAKLNWKSFTIIEVLTVIGFLSLNLPMIFSSFILAIKSYQRITYLREVKRNIDFTLNSIKYNIKQNAIAAYGNFDLSNKCSPNNYLNNLNKIYFVDRKGTRFFYYLENDRIASGSSKNNIINYLTSSKIKIDNLFFFCSQESNNTSPIISLTFRLNNIPNFEDIPYSFNFQTKIKIMNY